MSTGKQYKNEFDAGFSQTVEAFGASRPILNEPQGFTTVTGYPKLDIPDLLRSMEKLKEDGKKADEAMLDALVDIINRSPFSVPQWAGFLKMTLPELIEVCHRVDPVTEPFRLKVRVFFERFRGRADVKWEEFPPK